MGTDIYLCRVVKVNRSKSTATIRVFLIYYDGYIDGRGWHRDGMVLPTDPSFFLMSLAEMGDDLSLNGPFFQDLPYPNHPHPNP